MAHITNTLASSVARSSISVLFLRNLLFLPLSARHLFLASFPDRHSSYGDKMAAGSPKPTVSLQYLSLREGGSVFIDNAHKSLVEISDWSSLGHVTILEQKKSISVSHYPNLYSGSHTHEATNNHQFIIDILIPSQLIRF